MTCVCHVDQVCRFMTSQLSSLTSWIAHLCFIYHCSAETLNARELLSLAAPLARDGFKYLHFTYFNTMPKTARMEL